MGNTIIRTKNKTSGTYAILPSEDVDNYPLSHTEESKPLEHLPTMRSRAQLKQDEDFLKLQMEKI